jgi:hypothetical protein
MSPSAPEPARPVLFVAQEPGTPAPDDLAQGLDDLLDVVPLEIPLPEDPDSAASDIVQAIRRHGSTRWLIAGGGRASGIASRVASRTLAGRSGLFGLAGLVLLDRTAIDEPPAVPTLVIGAHADRVAALRSFWTEEAGTGPTVPADVSRAIASARTSTRVRALLAQRLLADDPGYAPRALSVAQLATLRAVADRVVPQDDSRSAGRIDLAARVDAQLADGLGDGWRNAALPADPVAYALGLDALAHLAPLAAAEQDALLTAVADGSGPAGALAPEQLSAWFEDCRVDLVRQWLAHPASLARVGYDGYASGGDTLPLTGFRSLGADQRDDWEPTTRSPR